MICITSQTLPCGGYHLGGDEVVGRQAVSSTEPTEAASTEVRDQTREFIVVPRRPTFSHTLPFPAAEKNLEEGTRTIVPSSPFRRFRLPVEKPEAKGRVRSGGQRRPTIAVEGDIEYRSRVAFDDPFRGSRTDVPQAERGVLASRKTARSLAYGSVSRQNFLDNN